MALILWCSLTPVVSLVAGFDNVDSLLVGTTSLLSPRISAGSVPMLGLAVCSAQCFAHPVPLPQKRLQDGQMFGVRNLSHRKRGSTFMRDLQNFEIPLIFYSYSLVSCVWRTSPVRLLEQQHRSHSITFDQCAFGTRGNYAAN